MFLETIADAWKLAKAANDNASSFPATLPTNTEPTGAGVFDLGGGAQFTQNGLELKPFGTGSDGNTLSINVFGWEKGVLPNSLGQFTWYPTLLCQLQATLSSTNVGPANAYNPNGASDYFAKTLTVTYGNAGVSVDAVSPAAAGYLAHAVVDLKGFRKVQLTFSTGGVATDSNALVRFL